MDLDPEDRDYLIRTIIGEAGNQSDEGKAAVAAVILNRLRVGDYGGSVKDVVLAPKQFEPWQTRRRELEGYSPDDPSYIQAAAIADDVASGALSDPTNGATHFMNTDTVYQRYGHLPQWGAGEGQRIGAHTFYAPNGRAPAMEGAQDTYIPSAADLQPKGDAVPEWKPQASPLDAVFGPAEAPAAQPAQAKSPLDDIFGPTAAPPAAPLGATGGVAPPGAGPATLPQQAPAPTPIKPMVPHESAAAALRTTTPGVAPGPMTGAPITAPQTPPVAAQGAGLAPLVAPPAGPGPGDFHAPPAPAPTEGFHAPLPAKGTVALKGGASVPSKDTMQDPRVDWTRLPGAIMQQLDTIFGTPGRITKGVYEGTIDPSQAGLELAPYLLGESPGMRGVKGPGPLEGEILPPLPGDVNAGIPPKTPTGPPTIDAEANAPARPPEQLPGQKALPPPTPEQAPGGPLEGEILPPAPKQPPKSPLDDIFGSSNPLPDTPEKASQSGPVTMVPGRAEEMGVEAKPGTTVYTVNRGGEKAAQVQFEIDGDVATVKSVKGTLKPSELRQARDQFLREHPEIKTLRSGKGPGVAAKPAPGTFDKGKAQKEFIAKPHVVSPTMLKMFEHVRDDTGYVAGQVVPATPMPVPEWYPAVNGAVQDLAKQMGMRVAIYAGEPTGTAAGVASSGGKSIIISSQVPKDQALAFAMHEYGHQVDFQQYTYASAATRRSIGDAYVAFLKDPALAGKTISQLKPVSLEGAPYGQQKLAGLPKQSLDYELNFPEWFAEQASRWLTTNKAPVTRVEKFFKGIADKWKQIYTKVVGHTPLSSEVDTFMRGLWKEQAEATPGAQPPVPATAPPTAAPSTSPPPPRTGGRAAPAPPPNPAGMPPMQPPRTAAPAGGGGRAPPPPRGPGAPPPTPRPQPAPRQPQPMPAQASTNPIARAARAIQAIFSPQTIDLSGARSAASIRKEIGLAARDSAVTAEELRPFEKRVNAMSSIERFNFIDYVEGRSQGATLFDPALQPIADALKKAYDDRKTKIMNTPSTAQAGFVDDYYPHLWKDVSAARTFMRGFGSKQGSGTNLRARSIPTIADGIAAGLEPITDNPIETTMRYVQNMDRFIAINTVWDKARATREIRYLQPKNAPPGWVKLNGRLAQKGHLQAYAPEGWARVWNNFISRGLHALGGGEFGEIFDLAQTASNNITAFELGLSGFHAATMVQESMVNEVARAVQELTRGQIVEGAKSLAGAIFSPVTLARVGKRVADAYTRPGSGSAREMQIADLLARAGGRAVGRGHAADYRFSMAHSYWASWKRGALKGELKADWAHIKAHPIVGPIQMVFKHVGRIMETVAAPLFEKYIPAIKNGSFAMNMNSWIEAHPNATQGELDKAAMDIWDSTDNRFGELVQDNIFWDKTLKQVAQITMRSFSWFLGTAREIGGGVKDIPKSMKGIAKGEGITGRTGYIIALPIVYATLNAIYQYMKTGQAPKSWQDLMRGGLTGGTLPANKYRPAIPERVMMPGYMKDVFGWWEDPYQEMLNKRSTALTLAAETLSGNDWKGTPWHDKVGNPGVLGAVEDWFKFVGQSMGPISVKQYAKGEKPGSNISTPEQMLGLRPAPMYLADPAGYKGMKAAQDIRAQMLQATKDKNAALAAGDRVKALEAQTRINDLKRATQKNKVEERQSYGAP